ncbi:carbamoyl-phosphate synthase L chain [Synechococcus sp. A10-1-5-1]|uniref:carbamoyl-phosphate synthase L chain n=1 Tax=Synechococcus sp. A10-1-5-1 TaxID=2936507 RepID=UPI002000A81D|nr:carbamoyl-phosphate synthase L chain [Synechococcus sp. A10-1-5-1]UPM49971.1 carbamoyl-phosphate synthase L chain [Synechococcus sp. A10-1-5-1]
MSISLKDVVKPRVGIQGQTQAAGTPNQAGLGGFLPLVVGRNSVFFADVLANANFADLDTLSSIVNTYVDGTTISTSSRIGYRYFNKSRAVVLGLNGGFESRPVKSGSIVGFANKYGLSLDERTPLFTQVSAEAEVVAKDWQLKPYALIPVGDKEQRLNNLAYAGALSTYGIDAGYNINNQVNVGVGYYYQNGDYSVSNSGIKLRLGYELSRGLEIYGKASYDPAFESRASIGFSYLFGQSPNGPIAANNLLKALTASPGNRDIRIHDCAFWDKCFWTHVAHDVESYGVKLVAGLTIDKIVSILKKIYSKLPASEQELADQIIDNPSEASAILEANPGLDAEVLAEAAAE